MISPYWYRKSTFWCWSTKVFMVNMLNVTTQPLGERVGNQLTHTNQYQHTHWWCQNIRTSVTSMKTCALFWQSYLKWKISDLSIVLGGPGSIKHAFRWTYYRHTEPNASIFSDSWSYLIGLNPILIPKFREFTSLDMKKIILHQINRMRWDLVT